MFRKHISYCVTYILLHSILFGICFRSTTNNTASGNNKNNNNNDNK